MVERVGSNTFLMSDVIAVTQPSFATDHNKVGILFRWAAAYYLPYVDLNMVQVHMYMYMYMYSVLYIVIMDSCTMSCRITHSKNQLCCTHHLRLRSHVSATKKCTMYMYNVLCTCTLSLCTSTMSCHLSQRSVGHFVHLHVS